MIAKYSVWTVKTRTMVDIEIVGTVQRRWRGKNVAGTSGVTHLLRTTYKSNKPFPGMIVCSGPIRKLGRIRMRNIFPHARRRGRRRSFGASPPTTPATPPSRRACGNVGGGWCVGTRWQHRCRPTYMYKKSKGHVTSLGTCNGPVRKSKHRSKHGVT